MDSEWLSSRTSLHLKDEVLDTSRSVHTQNIIVFILVLYANRMQIEWTDSLLEEAWGSDYGDTSE